MSMVMFVACLFVFRLIPIHRSCEADMKDILIKIIILID